MTTPPLLALAAAKDVLTGVTRHPHGGGDRQPAASARSSAPSTRLQRPIHIECSVTIKDRLPSASGTSRDRRRGRDAYLTANIRRRQELLTARLRDIFRIIRAAAAACPLRALLASMTTYLPAAFTSASGPSTLVYPHRLPSITDLILAPCPPLASGTSSGSVARLRRPVQLAPPLPMTTCLKAAFRTAFGPYPPRLPSVTATSSI
jgi:hypothetical protein